MEFTRENIIATKFELIDNALRALHIAKYDPCVGTYIFIDAPMASWNSHVATAELTEYEQAFNQIIQQHYNSLPVLPLKDCVDERWYNEVQKLKYASEKIEKRHGNLLR